MNLFVYGTLIEQRVITRVVGRPLPAPVPAVLHGYRRWETTLGYPVVLPEPGASCTGMVYYAITEADWKALDGYERANTTPPAYHRKLVSVVGAHGRISAYVYIGNLNYFRARIKL